MDLPRSVDSAPAGSPPFDQADLVAAVADLESAQAAVTHATARRDELIRRAIAAGTPVKELATTTGMSLARIYQVRDGRR